jgi:hypothetical protein
MSRITQESVVFKVVKSLLRLVKVTKKNKKERTVFYCLCFLLTTTIIKRGWVSISRITQELVVFKIVKSLMRLVKVTLKSEKEKTIFYRLCFFSLHSY